jgi:hypothetical protein
MDKKDKGKKSKNNFSIGELKNPRVCLTLKGKSTGINFF